VLTKPIGSGGITSAIKAGKLPPEELAEALTTMTALNKPGRDAGVALSHEVEALPVHACTDVTGFGLLGHAYEMAIGSGLSLEIRAASVPLLRHALDLARAGTVTRAHKSTLTHIGDALSIADGIEEALVKVLADAQTSGGLLMSVDPQHADLLLQLLDKYGALCGVVIGQTIPRAGDVAIKLV